MKFTLKIGMLVDIVEVDKNGLKLNAHEAAMLCGINGI